MSAEGFRNPTGRTRRLGEAMRLSSSNWSILGSRQELAQAADQLEAMPDARAASSGRTTTASPSRQCRDPHASSIVPVPRRANPWLHPIRIETTEARCRNSHLRVGYEGSTWLCSWRDDRAGFDEI